MSFVHITCYLQTTFYIVWLQSHHTLSVDMTYDGGQAKPSGSERESLVVVEYIKPLGIDKK